MNHLVHNIIKIVIYWIKLEKEVIFLLRVVWGNHKIDIRYSRNLVYDFKTYNRLENNNTMLPVILYIWL